MDHLSQSHCKICSREKYSYIHALKIQTSKKWKNKNPTVRLWDNWNTLEDLVENLVPSSSFHSWRTSSSLAMNLKVYNLRLNISLIFDKSTTFEKHLIFLSFIILNTLIKESNEIANFQWKFGLLETFRKIWSYSSVSTSFF